MQMIAVKRVKVTNGNIANTCLSAATFFLPGVDRKNASFELTEKAFFCCSVRLSTSENLSSKTEVKISSIIHVNLIFTLFTCILHVLRMQYITINFPQTKFTSRTAVRDILTIPSVVSIKGTDQIDWRVYSSISSLRASSPIWASEASLARTRERGAFPLPLAASPLARAFSRDSFHSPK